MMNKSAERLGPNRNPKKESTSENEQPRKISPEEIIDQEYEKYINNDKTIIIPKMKQELKNGKIIIKEYGIQMGNTEGQSNIYSQEDEHVEITDQGTGYTDRKTKHQCVHVDPGLRRKYRHIGERQQSTPERNFEY